MTDSGEERSGGEPRLPHPGVRFPPPFLFAAGFLGGLAIERWVYRLPLTATPPARQALAAVGWLCVVAALSLVAWALLTFRAARTAIIPNQPARRLVRSGPYRFSRNPMYLALTVLYLGLALVFNLGWPILFGPAVIASLIALVIQREERYLAGAFDTEYADYRRDVRRWL
jgi:protein-S-isoprenylcysteine O-methyltransferase Ste14